MKSNNVMILFTVLVFSIATSKKAKIGKWRRQYEELEKTYSRLAQRQQEQGDQLYRVIDGLKSLCQGLQATPWDSEETNEPDITPSFTDITAPPSTTHQVVNGLRPLACRFKYEEQLSRYEVDFEAESKPNIVWHTESGLIIQDDKQHTIINYFTNFKGTATLVSSDEIVQVKIILGPVQYIVYIDATHRKVNETEVSLKPIGITIGKTRRKEFILGDVLEFITTIPKSPEVTGSTTFVVMDKNNPHKAREFRIAERKDETGPFRVESLDSPEFSRIVFTLDTGKNSMEGVFTQEAMINIVRPSQPMITLTESQSIMFYQANRSSPYPDDFAAFVDNANYKTRSCAEGKPCMIVCKALGSLLGDVYITKDGKHPESVSTRSEQIKLWGGIHLAVFTIEHFNADRDTGNYTCQARSQYKSAVTQYVQVTSF